MAENKSESNQQSDTSSAENYPLPQSVEQQSEPEREADESAEAEAPSTRNYKERFREFLKNWEILLQLIVPSIFSVGVLIVISIQASIYSDQRALMQKQTEIQISQVAITGDQTTIMERQTKIMEDQAKAAQDSANTAEQSRQHVEETDRPNLQIMGTAVIDDPLKQDTKPIIKIKVRNVGPIGTNIVNVYYRTSVLHVGEIPRDEQPIQWPVGPLARRTGETTAELPTVTILTKEEIQGIEGGTMKLRVWGYVDCVGCPQPVVQFKFDSSDFRGGYITLR
jgi:hypothetical protein